MAKCFKVFLKGVEFRSINNNYIKKVNVYFDGICGIEYNIKIENKNELKSFAEKNIKNILK